MMKRFPDVQGMYNPANEHDNCGIGFVAHIKGKPSHCIVAKGLEILKNLNHRGATGSDNKSGDGAGILLQIPHQFYNDQNLNLPEAGTYGTGIVFLPQDKKQRKVCMEVIEQNAIAEGLQIIDWRNVPVNSKEIGSIARKAEPYIEQVFLTANVEQDVLERKLYLVRKLSEKAIFDSVLSQKEHFYICSLSSKTIVYKGMLTPRQLSEYYLDLTNPNFKSAIALTHSRFSTNTFPTWDLAQPFRIVAHNGEINTIKGNRLWMHAREALLKSEMFGDDLRKLLPVIEQGKSDSASFDNVLEFLFHCGRSIPHVLCMMIPESFNDKNPIPQSLKAFYEFHSTLMEAWDGPASIVFSDGRYIGGTLDRNGLRPSRYIITHNDLIVMGSEVGVQEFDVSEIKEKGRLKPGKILLVDTQLGIVIPDEEVKAELTRRNPYGNWLKENRLILEDIKVKQRVVSSLGENFNRIAKIFSYSREDFRVLLKPMSETAKEPIGSMGNDTPLAVFSERAHRFFDYFRQVFAQVTNPPIDPIREGLVMSLTNYIGAVKANVLSESPKHAHLIKFESPIITNTDLGKIKDLKHQSFNHKTISMVFPVKEGVQGFKKTFEQMLHKAETAVDEGKNYIILSDRKVSKEYAPIPSLLAVSAVHHHLIRSKKRIQVGIIVETGEAREVMHFALLLGFGASVINPYVAFAAIDELVQKGEINLEYKEARKNYIKAVDNGILKVMSKMGISTLRSFHGSQIFEAVGLSKDLVNKYFTGTESRIGGIGFDEICKESLLFHEAAFTEENQRFETQGSSSYRKYGEHRAWGPETIGLLQWSTKANNYKIYKEYSSLVEKENQKPSFIRGALQWKKNPINISEVEPIEKIMKRFVTGAMSYGSISKEAHETLAIAMNRIGGRSNTGEGGESTERFGDHRRSAIKQIASGRFGVNNNYLINADELQIKVAQGAKPGEGGQLPGFKVNKVIAKTRKSTLGITLISPPPHHDIYSIEDLAQLIYDLKCTNPKAKVSVKLVSENGVGTIAAGVAKAYSDLIVISGCEGGTGASPLSSIYRTGLPLEFGIAETQQTLVLNNLRGRVKLQVDGQLKTGYDVVKLALLGAEEFGFSTSALIVLGCVMMRKCHLNTCPAGIATQSKKLRERFIGKAEYLVHFFEFIAQEVRECLSEIGVRSLDEIIGRSDLLEVNKAVTGWKMKNVDFTSLLHFPEDAKINPIRFKKGNVNQVKNHLDHQLIQKCSRAIKSKQRVWISSQVNNTDRTIGAMLSGEISKRYREEGLKKDTINCTFVGSAGQSFGAFLTKGIAFRLEGDANDYLGKGLSGGKITLVPPKKSTFVPEKNIIAGNTLLYGATDGELYIHGVVGERFAVRNSGAKAVVEGTGDHCCEYMTGGRVVVLGKTGRNFAAGMSGGIAYVLNQEGNFAYLCNQELVDLDLVEDRSDIEELQDLIHQHLLQTQSELAAKILGNWDEYLPCFVKVIPFEYKKVLEKQKLKELKRKLAETEDLFGIK